jgi:hypothetical protein
LAAAIKKARGYDVQIEPGDRGAFEIWKDDTRVFSKLDLGRFPTSDDEVLALL